MKQNHSKLFFVVFFLFLMLAVLICIKNKDTNGINKLSLGASIASVMFSFSDLCSGMDQFDEDYSKEKKKKILKAEAAAIKDKPIKIGRCLFCRIQLATYNMHRVLSGICFAAGCLLFFLILMFYNENEYEQISALEKPLTVIAFAVIILNYFIRDSIIKRHTKEVEGEKENE
ncbi:MAG: hypothetical protein II897_05845 [Clostridia bacterium]|nr:hypothetical protein [Clostridia bacterium]